ncbi:MAG: sugar ABC transporter substrate-binding protein [Desulfobacterales bacterium]|nr:MAG: sugar ABC transporter substrate-binding protein [Desulfobacterales bacterium]
MMDAKKGAPKKIKQWAQHNKEVQEIQEHVNAKGLVGFAEKQAKLMDRRKFISTMALTTGGLTALSQFGFEHEAHAAPKRFKAAYSAIIMAVFWVTKGAETFQHLGKLAGFDFDIYDATADSGKQRSQIDLIASKADEYDVVFIHPAAIGAYTEPVKELISKGVVVVDIDTLLVPDLSTLDILTFTEPDNIFMGSQVTEYLCKKIGYKGNVVHTQGQLTHTGAQGRAKGFRQVVSKYPDIKVIDETPGEWSVDKTRQIWDSLLVKYEKIDGGFFHNDDMALGAYAALQAVDRAKDTVLCGVDAMAPALRELKKGHIQATVFNPACRVHGYAFWAAWFHLVNKVKKADIPTFIRCDGPVVTVESKPEEIDSYIWCNEHFLI